MVTDEQVRRLMRYRQNQKTLAGAAAKAGMDEKTARKYWKAQILPSQMKKERTWRTRDDPFSQVWPEITDLIQTNDGLEAKTIFDYLQRKYPGDFADGQLRTLQRRIRQWRALQGPEKEVYFPQEHHPGVLSQSDFTHLSALGITLAGAPFPHLIYHFVLTYSNWETGCVCFSESFESLSEGLQNALWELGGVPQAHQSDRLSCAVQKVGEGDGDEFTPRYRALLRHYGLQGRAIQAGRANENGDVEQRHHRFKRALEQALLLRGHRDFASRTDYEAFLRDLFSQLNAGRRERFREEQKVLRRLPQRRLDDCRKYQVKVGSGSTVHVLHNTYSVSSRLIGERVEVRVYAQELEVWYGQRCVEKIPRLRGESQHRIDYRHIIAWLLRKPGAFAHYRYRSDLFPSSQFRMAYDHLRQRTPARADKEYLRILHLAALQGERRVEEGLRHFFGEGLPLSAQGIESRLRESVEERQSDVPIPAVDLRDYDQLLEGEVREWES